MREQIPIKRARIEWNVGGPFRISDIDTPGDYALRMSGGACFTAWQQCDDDRILLGWLYRTALAAIIDECDVGQVAAELGKVAVDFEFEHLISMRTPSRGEEVRHV